MSHFRISDAEWMTRCDLAAFYRLFAHNGWTDLLATHITARVPDQPNTYLIAPNHLMFEEVTASSILKVDLDGNLLTKGQGGYSKAGHLIHSAILRQRPDVNFVAHTHTQATVAISALECGLMPYSQQSLVALGTLSYHDYGIGTLNQKECKQMSESLGDNMLMLLRNHGTLACGRTPGEAFLHLHWLEQACRIQVDLMSCGSPVVVPDDVAIDNMQRYAHSEHPIGKVMWKAQLRMLDRKVSGYQS